MSLCNPVPQAPVTLVSAKPQPRSHKICLLGKSRASPRGRTLTRITNNARANDYTTCCAASVVLLLPLWGPLGHGSPVSFHAAYCPHPVAFSLEHTLFTSHTRKLGAHCTHCSTQHCTLQHAHCTHCSTHTAACTQHCAHCNTHCTTLQCTHCTHCP